MKSLIFTLILTLCFLPLIPLATGARARKVPYGSDERIRPYSAHKFGSDPITPPPPKTTVLQVLPKSNGSKIPAFSNVFMIVVQESQNVSKTLPIVPIDSIKLANDGMHAAHMDIRANTQDPIKDIQTCAYCWNDRGVRCYRHPQISITHKKKYTPIDDDPMHDDSLTINFYPEDIFQIFTICSKEESLKKFI